MKKVLDFIIPKIWNIYWFCKDNKTMRRLRYRLSFLKVFWSSYYETSRNYGGSEEGGWWYTSYEFRGSSFTPFGFGSNKAHKAGNELGYIVCYETKKGENEDMAPHYYE